MPDQRLAWIPATPMALATVRSYSAGFFLYGLLIFIQGPRRWMNPNLMTANDLFRWLPWAPSYTWGCLFMVAAGVALFGSLTYRFNLRNKGVYGFAGLIGFLGVTACISAFRVHTASFAGGFLYIVVGIAICFVARTREVRPDAGFPQVP